MSLCKEYCPGSQEGKREEEFSLGVEMSEDAPKEQVKAVEERITKLTAGFNVWVKELREQARH